MVEHSMHEQPPPGRRGHQELNDVLRVRSVLTWRQTGDADEHQRRQSSVLTQLGIVAQCHRGNDASKHTIETEFSPEPVTSVVHGGEGICVLTSLLSTPTELRRSVLTATFAAV